MSANAAECPPANAPVSVRRRKMHFESVIPNNAFYCFHANDFNHLKALLHEKTKTQLYKERVMYRRGYHMNRRDFEIYVASVF